MLKTTVLLVAFAATLGAQTSSKRPAKFSAVGDARALWQMNANFVLRSAEMAPDSMYAWKPVSTVRSFGQLIGHVAGAQHMFCSMILGEKMASEDAIEKTVTTKAGLISAMKESNAHCERAYALSDKAAGASIDLFGTQRSKLFALMLNAAHDDEHYGNLVTYMRMNGMVPPSSMPQQRP